MSEVDWAQTGVIGGLVLSILWTGLKRKWLFAWVHDTIVNGLKDQLVASQVEAQEWKHMALIQAGVMEETVNRTARLVTRVVDPAEQRLDLKEPTDGR